MSGLNGKISQVIGPVVDVHFELVDGKEKQLPAIHEALVINRSDGRELIVEVQQHIGEDTVRTVAMDSTDGLRRGMTAVCTGSPITMPVGPQIRGRVMNVTGEAIDGMSEMDRAEALPIHREPPKFEDLMTSQEVLFTGIKVIDLLEPYLKGGKIGLFGGAGVVIDEHPSFPSVSPSNASSISSSGILSMLKGFLLALMIIVKWSSYR